MLLHSKPGTQRSSFSFGTFDLTFMSKALSLGSRSLLSFFSAFALNMPYLDGLDDEGIKHKKPLAVCSEALDSLRVFGGSHLASFSLLDQAEHGPDSWH